MLLGSGTKFLSLNRVLPEVLVGEDQVAWMGAGYNDEAGIERVIVERAEV